MPDKELPSYPNVEQYKKQSKELARDFAFGAPDALSRVRRHHPRFHKLPEGELRSACIVLTDAQLVLAREHGFASWLKFAGHIETLRLIRSVASLSDPVTAFFEVACAPRHTDHRSGTLQHAEMILSRYPEVATSSIYTAAVLGDEDKVLSFLARVPGSASAKGGPNNWDPLTYLCFSRYLQLDQARSEAFVRIARALLDAGASANTGWIETVDHPEPKPILESAIYAAAAIAQHPELTRLLLERGADPNDDETPYHVPESYDNTVMKIMIESGKLNPTSLCWMLVRKADWHDEAGMRLLLEHGADPNLMPRFGNTALQHALRRDNRLPMIDMLLDHSADPNLESTRDGRTGAAIAARRGRGDVLASLERRSIPFDLMGVDRLIAACAKGDREAIDRIVHEAPGLVQQLRAEGGALLANFSGIGNIEGLRCLLNLGIDPAAPHEDDPYFDVAGGTALHVAAWRAWPSAVKELIARGAPIDATDAKGRTALALAVKACVDSHWTNRRSPDSVEALLLAGATKNGIDIPSGYEPVDRLLLEHAIKA